MKGTIRQNLGASRYVVGVRSAVQPLADELQKYQDLYQATIPKITDAYGVLNERRGDYQAALAAVRVVAADYELCRLAFSSTTCIDSGNAACNNAYSEADSACLDIESGIGECDPDCQRERERCHDAAVRVRTACLAQVAIDCAEAEYAHVLECQTTYSPLIAEAQAAALALLPGMQEALYNLHHEQAIQWQLARKLNELEGIDNREYQVTCFSAQWDEELAVGSEVEMARTPNGRNVITSLITAPTPCLHDARVLPSGHLFVNASLAPGFETWRPTWRVGTVLEVIPPNLRVQFAPANIAGSLGTLYSENPLDCTPPQCYFDGKDPKEAEADIRAARTALTEAQQALVDAVALRADCLAEFDQAWMDQCYGAAVELCDAAFGDAMEQPTLDKGACYDDAQGTCEEQTTAGLEACALTYQPAIDEAQGEVDAATAVLGEATGDLTGAQNALAAIEAEIQACVDAVNTQEWLDDERDRLTGLCAEAADDRKQECLDYGNTAAECQLVRDAVYADCVALIDEQLPLRQAAARDKCQEDRQAEVDAAEGEIDAAYTAVNNAEIALRQVTGALEIAEKALADCLDQWVLGDCLASAIQICDDTYELAEDTYTQRRAACYQEAMDECDRQRDEAIDACYAAHADAIAAAQTAVDEAARDVELATNGRYHPADPLILEVPVAHCGADSYIPGDSVLIDFPVRSGQTAMAVWQSARVIGWADNTRRCYEEIFWPEWVGINITCTISAWARRRGKRTAIIHPPPTPMQFFDFIYECPTSDWDPGIGYTGYAYDANIRSLFVYQSDEHPGFEVRFQPGISFDTTYSDTVDRLTGTGSYIFYTDPSNSRSYLIKYNYDMTRCSPQFEPGDLYSGHHDNMEYLIPNHNQEIVTELNIPGIAELRHLATGEVKAYYLRLSSLGGGGDWPIDPADLLSYQGGMSGNYYPLPEE
ncbi:MAG: hypothetical protein KAX46_01880 [Chromatiaceae bacterium]|nr:hypothetical protein [Chromatiaceae bacterium]